MSNIFEESLTVKATDVDFNNKLKIDSIFDFMQNAASKHAADLNVGYSDLEKLNLFWALSWAKIQILKYPGFDENIHLTTWPKTKYSLYTMRDFIAKDESNNYIFKATTAWVLLNLVTKKITSTDKLPIAIQYISEKTGLDAVPSKIQDVADKKIVYSKGIKYSDIDINKHVNNAKYISFILDVFDKDFYDNYMISSLAISFLSETKYSDEIKIESGNKNDHEVFVDAFNKSNNRYAFKSILGISKLKKDEKF